MAVTHPAAVRSVIADAVTATIGASGKLVFQTGASAVVATLPFSATAFGAASNGVSTANPITSDTNAAGGTIAKAEMQTSGSVAKVLCSVTATGGGGIVRRRQQPIFKPFTNYAIYGNGNLIASNATIEGVGKLGPTLQEVKNKRTLIMLMAA